MRYEGDDIAHKSTRDPLDVLLEQAAWDIWAHVKLHKDSLDGERATAVIRKRLDAASAMFEERVAKANQERDNMRKERDKLKRQMAGGK